MAQSKNISLDFSRSSLGRFLVVTVQLALVLLVIHAFQIEQVKGFLELTPLIFGGFVIHAWLPLKYRQPFFLLVSVVGIVMLLRFPHSLGLFAIGLGLIGICHLPLALRWRVSLLVLAGAVIAALRAELIPTSWEALPALVLPIIGAMFMFRLAVYLYDTQHERTPATIWERLNYFFMLPNVCFLLFPVIDYQTFRRTYYDDDALAIYQKGILWMFRGVVHLVLYRVIYYYYTPTPSEVVGLWGVLHSMLTTYLFYLRISGQFHLIIGILCLFGYNLQETHHLYYLASSFNDYWRRINIYWKDFMMKLFYYPAFMRLRKKSMVFGLAWATVWVFFGTWILHAYQWFWLRGDFPLTGPDALFWGILGVLVVFNAVQEVRKGRKRTLGKAAWSFKASAVHAAKVVGMFLFITTLWSLWSSPSVGAFVTLLATATESTAMDYLLFVLVLAGLVLAGVLVQYLNSRGIELSVSGSHPSFRRSAIVTGVGALFLLLIGQPQVQQQLGEEATAYVSAVQEARFNQRDQELMERGYYEGLLESKSFTSALWQVRSKQPPGWNKTIVQVGAARRRSDLLRYEMVPNMQVEFKQAQLSTNRWGMRDKDYAQQPDSMTYRMAVLGASDEMGWGVEDDEVFEALVEDQLNSTHGGQRYAGYEILNFSVSGYSLLQNVMISEQQVLNFQPRTVLYMAHANYDQRLLDTFTRTIEENGAIPYPFLQDVMQRAGVRAGMPASESMLLLRPLVDEVVAWGYAQMVTTYRQAGVLPVWVYLPRTYDEGDDFNVTLPHIKQLAEDAGFVTMNMAEAYADLDQRMIQLAAWDKHPNARGHQRLADALYRQLELQADTLSLW